MPTGYTAGIEKGMSFKEFALSCARNFGALIMMRDDPMDAPIKEFKPCTYHQESIDKAKKTLMEVERMTGAECEEASRKEYQERIEFLKNGAGERVATKAKYEAMLAKVKAYTPPSPDHVGLKTFMVDQIEESIRFDCSDYYEEEIGKVTLEPGLVWKKRVLEKCAHDIAYHSREHQKEVERTESRNKWVIQLKESLEDATL